MSALTRMVLDDVKKGKAHPGVLPIAKIGHVGLPSVMQVGSVEKFVNGCVGDVDCDSWDHGGIEEILGCILGTL